MSCAAAGHTPAQAQRSTATTLLFIGFGHPDAKICSSSTSRASLALALDQPDTSTRPSIAAGKSDIDVITIVAPAILSCWASSAVAWLAPANPIDFMPAATAAR